MKEFLGYDMRYNLAMFYLICSALCAWNHWRWMTLTFFLAHVDTRYVFLLCQPRRNPPVFVVKIISCFILQNEVLNKYPLLWNGKALLTAGIQFLPHQTVPVGNACRQIV